MSEVPLYVSLNPGSKPTELRDAAHAWGCRVTLGRGVVGMWGNSDPPKRLLQSFEALNELSARIGDVSRGIPAQTIDQVLSLYLWVSVSRSLSLTLSLDH